MFLQHRNHAALWENLAGQSNISDTLREITGQHALQSAIQGHEQWHANGSIQHIIWIKTILDLQRCYLSGISQGVSECPPNVSACLLPLDLLFSSILYLLDVKARSFSYSNTISKGDMPLANLIVAQTIVSGLRLLLLRKEALSQRQRQQLQSAIHVSWRDEDVQGAERFITQEILVAMLDSLNDPNHVDPYQTERAKAQIPSYATGLVRLTCRLLSSH